MPPSSSAAWTIDDLILQESAGEWALAPGQASAAWVRTGVATVEGEEQEIAHRWLSDLARASSRPLTSDAGTVAAPRFAPGGAQLAFLSSCPLPEEVDEEVAPNQLWVLSVTGCDPRQPCHPRPLTRGEREPVAFGWLDAQRLVVAIPEGAAEPERERRRRGDRARAIEAPEEEPAVRLHLLSSVTGESSRLGEPEEGWIDQLAVAPGGRYVLLRVQQSLSCDFDERLPPRLFLQDLEDGGRRELLAETALLPREMAWAPDGSGFYFTHERSRHHRYRLATITELFYVPLATGEPEPVELAWERGLAGDWCPTPDGVVTLLADGVRVRPVRLRREPAGWRRLDLSLPPGRALKRLRVSPDGNWAVFQESEPGRSPQWSVARLAGSTLAEVRPLTDLNPGHAGKISGRVELLNFPGARAETVEAILHYPVDWHQGESRPLVLLPHGGPHAVDLLAWESSWAKPIVLLTQRGAFVLQINYHGSAGYGLDWAESVGEGRLLAAECEDLAAATAALVARGLADPARVAGLGWSYGGILLTELLARGARLAAACVGAATVEWFSDWGSTDYGGAFGGYYLGGSPAEVPERYLQKSVLLRLSGVATPILIHVPGADRVAPPGQGWSLFRLLQQEGQAPVRLVVYPEEPHRLRGIAHQRRKLAEDLAWLERYLFSQPAARPQP